MNLTGERERQKFRTYSAQQRQTSCHRPGNAKPACSLSAAMPLKTRTSSDTRILPEILSFLESFPGGNGFRKAAHIQVKKTALSRAARPEPQASDLGTIRCPPLPVQAIKKREPGGPRF